MVRPNNKPTAAERELRAYTDELGVRHHAERLVANLGAIRAVEILEQITRSIAARCPSPSLSSAPIPKQKGR